MRVRKTEVHAALHHGAPFGIAHTKDPAMPTVLILESDSLSRVHYLRALSGLPNTCVVASSSEQEARVLVSAITPDVVVADVHWLQQDRQSWLARSSERSAPSVVAIQETTAHSLNATNCRVIACFAKPVDGNELRRAVQEQLVKVSPDLWFGLAEYLKLACQGRRSLQLAFTSSIGSGVVTIEQGQIWSASYNGVSGFAALALALGCGAEHVALWPPLVHTNAREIAGEWSMLVASAVEYLGDATGEGNELRPQQHELDFSDVLAPTIVPVSSVIESGEKLRSGRGSHEAIIVDAVSAVIQRRYTDALASFEEACELMPDNGALAARVKWLRTLLTATHGYSLGER
jgi:CheY-like chemotaxis protein